jgi:hypothetical protein
MIRRLLVPGVLALLCGAVVPALAGCSSKGADAGTSSDDAITEVKQTPVKDQSIGNCWTYATTGWVESLVKTAKGTDMNLSESYVNYWYWFSQITQGSLNGDAISEGGSWGTAVELISSYGMMDEGAFIPAEASAQRSAHQAAAVKAIDESLKTGALKTPEARANATLVRTELNKAWGLDDTVVKYLDQTFGPDAARDLRTLSVPQGVPIYAAKDLPAKLANATTKKVDDVTLADAIGTASEPWNTDVRTGPYAWSQAIYPTTPKDRRDFLKRVQRALHAEQPVLLSWYVDFNALDAQGRFFAPPAMPGSQGSHMVVMYDYEVTDVPGFGTLKAGVLETRPEALEAALSDDAKISFLRIKNSWGDYHSPVITGYHDLYMTYLNGPMKECATDADEKPILDQCHDDVPFGDVILPAGF